MTDAAEFPANDSSGFVFVNNLIKKLIVIARISSTNGVHIRRRQRFTERFAACEQRFGRQKRNSTFVFLKQRPFVRYAAGFPSIRRQR